MSAPRRQFRRSKSMPPRLVHPESLEESKSREPLSEIWPPRCSKDNVLRLEAKIMELMDNNFDDLEPSAKSPEIIQWIVGMVAEVVRSGYPNADKMHDVWAAIGISLVFKSFKDLSEDYGDMEVLYDMLPESFTEEAWKMETMVLRLINFDTFSVYRKYTGRRLCCPGVAQSGVRHRKRRRVNLITATGAP